MKRKRQGYDDRLEESLADRRGPESVFRQSAHARRDESKGMEKRESGHAYAGDHDMDEHDKTRLHNHMKSAEHKFMSQLYRRRVHKK